MRIVSNTGPLLHLTEAQTLSLLRFAGELHIPAMVAIELGRQLPTWQTPEWIMVDNVTGIFGKQAIAWQQAGLLDPGEAEAIALVSQIQADWFLTDDAAARLLAQSLNLEVHGSLGIVLWAAAVGHLSQGEAEQALERLSHSSLWISTRILADARAALTTMFQE
jgi:predicted nucleic acid-binding protein